MQDVLTFAIDSIALTAAAYFLIGFCLHLHCCWVNSSVKAAPIAPAVKPSIEQPAAPVAAELLEIAEGISAIEVTLAEVVAVVESIEAQPNPVLFTDWNRIVPFRRRQPRSNYASLSSIELRKLCSDRGIRWRGVKAGKHLSKPEMLAVLAG